MSVAFRTGWCETVDRSSRYKLMSEFPPVLRRSSASIFAPDAEPEHRGGEYR
jgi:hypothetical protein